jgi:BASS family bile acid:Na+ symporter
MGRKTKISMGYLDATSHWLTALAVLTSLCCHTGEAFLTYEPRARALIGQRGGVLLQVQQYRSTCPTTLEQREKACRRDEQRRWHECPVSNARACAHTSLYQHTHTSVTLASSVSNSAENDEHEHDDDSQSQSKNDTTKTSRLDSVLSSLTSMFPLFVLSSALIGAKQPSLLLWVNNGPIITIMLASVMIGMGMTLTKKDFDKVFESKKQVAAVPIGVLCQFGIMPLSALIVGKYIMKLPPSLYLGLVLVGCSPGGTASNLVALIANADVALSVVLTSCSTILASVATPLLVKWLVSSGTSISINGWTLCAATAKVVLAPILAGMAMNAQLPKLCNFVSRFTPFASVVLVALICGGVVSQNAAAVVSSGMGWAGVATALKAVLLLHSLGFLAGYMIPRKLLGLKERTARTVSIETGMQNSALAVVLARSITGADSLASLPGALSATMHSCLGSMLAAYWRNRTDDLDEE